MNRVIVEGLIRELLREIEPGTENEPRNGIVDTPARVARAYAENFDGYAKNGAMVLSSVFPDDVIPRYDGMVIVKDIAFHSTCEHHMAPFYGVAHIGYIPQGKNLLGISKLARLTEIYAHRLQVQERMTEQVADDLETYLEPMGVMVVVKATHTCMSGRGVRAHGAETITSAVRGVFFTELPARTEFMALINMR